MLDNDAELDPTLAQALSQGSQSNSWQKNKRKSNSDRAGSPSSKQKKEVMSTSQELQQSPDSMDRISQNSKANSAELRNQKGSVSVSGTDPAQQSTFANSLEYDKVKKGNNVKKINRKDGSLLDLFQSEYFTIHMLFRYLYKSTQEGVIEYLINKLYNEPISQLDFYLPQLCYMIVTKEDCSIHSIEKFILEQSIRHCNIGIRALQYFQSFSEDMQALYQDKAMDFYNLLEGTLVNGDIPLKYLKNKTHSLKKFEEYCDKKYKADYLGLQVKFVDQLKYLSIKLKTFMLCDRNLILTKRLEELNNWIDSSVRSQLALIKTSCKYKYNGVVLPFSEGDDEDPSVVMRIIPELAQPFDTKKRAPFKIVLETVRLSEIIKVMDATEPRQETPMNGQEETTKFETTQNNYQAESVQNTQFQMTVDDEGSDEQPENPFAITNDQKVTLNTPQEEVKNDQLKHQEINFKGFEKYAKFVEFEERLFEQDRFLKDENSIFDQEIPRYKTAQSMIVRDDEIDNNIINTSNHSSPREYDLQVHKRNSEIDQQIQAIGRRSVDPDQVIQKFNSRKSSSAHMQERKASSPTVHRDNTIIEENSPSPKMGQSAKSESDFEDWDVVSVSELDLEGMDDPFKDKWYQIQKKYYAMSDYKQYKTYRLKPLIVKANDDLRQEVLAMQLMKRMQQIFHDAKLNIYLRPYDIFITSSSSGMVEFIPDTASIDSLKKKFPKKVGSKPWTLRTFFDKYFVNNFEEAQKNFVESLAGYSLYNYIFNVKDRHNGNILLDCRGRIIHIDFGFMLQNAPGGINFEGAPFKLTQEYIDIMDGIESEIFEYFKSLLIRGFHEIRKHLEDILILIEIFLKDSKLPCFTRPQTLFNEIRDRISLRFNTGENKENDYFEMVDRILKSSANNWRTTQYDSFQRMTNSICP